MWNREYGFSDDEDEDFLPQSKRSKTSPVILLSSGGDIDDADLTARSHLTNFTEQQSTSQTPPLADDLSL